VSAALVPVVRIIKGVTLLILPMAFIGKHSSIVTHAVMNVLLNVALVYVVILLSNSLEVRPVFYMLVPAAFFTMLKSRSQRDKFRSGRSMEESLHKNIIQLQGGQPDSEYRDLLLRREYVNEVASLLGLLLGGILFLAM
jgi:hypothetical protein